MLKMELKSQTYFIVIVLVVLETEQYFNGVKTKDGRSSLQHPNYYTGKIALQEPTYWTRKA